MKTMKSTVVPKIEEKKVIKIKLGKTPINGKDHLQGQLNYPARVQQDKRFKKPKYKNVEID